MEKLNARDVLGMDKHGVMAVGIEAIQKLLHTLKSYKDSYEKANKRCFDITAQYTKVTDEIKRLQFLLRDKEDECQSHLDKYVELQDYSQHLELHIEKLDQQIKELQTQTVMLKCVTINIDEL